MSAKSNEAWSKPKLQKLKLVGNKVRVKGKLYSLKEILNKKEFDKYFDFHNQSPSEERYYHL